MQPVKALLKSDNKHEDTEYGIMIACLWLRCCPINNEIDPVLCKDELHVASVSRLVVLVNALFRNKKVRDVRICCG